jgi:hypothetical protein
MMKLSKLFLLLIPFLFAGCATYESQPVYHSAVTAYSGMPAPYYYYPAPTAYRVVPAPVYVAPPAYIDPTPSFNLHIQSNSGFRRNDYSRGDREGRGHRHKRDSRQGGSGWSGTVWSR